MHRRRVLIVGGVIAGLALAPMLARTGVAVEVIERAPVWPPAGTGIIYLPGNAARALGLGAQVASRAVEIPRQRFYDHHGRLLCEVDVAELWAAVGPCLALHRADLHALLREAAGDVPIRNGLSRYSLGNQMLIAVECHARGIIPTYVAGFRAFLALNRCVRKGERAIHILAKCAELRWMRFCVRAGARVLRSGRFEDLANVHDGLDPDAGYWE